MNGYDELNYEWSFDKPSLVQIIKTDNADKKITVNFNEI